MELKHILAVLTLVGIYALYRVSTADKRAHKKYEALKKRERWGELICESESGESWDLARWVGNRTTDSRPYLASLGFKILGISNEMILWAEPPLGWRKIQDNHPLWTNIFDENGKLRFKYFYTNDIMNLSDYRAVLYPENKVV